jgi:hypothetical protein
MPKIKMERCCSLTEAENKVILVMEKKTRVQTDKPKAVLIPPR